jgi:hypothetical protein
MTLEETIEAVNYKSRLINAGLEPSTAYKAAVAMCYETTLRFREPLLNIQHQFLSTEPPIQTLAMSSSATNSSSSEVYIPLAFARETEYQWLVWMNAFPSNPPAPPPLELPPILETQEVQAWDLTISPMLLEESREQYRQMLLEDPTLEEEWICQVNYLPYPTMYVKMDGTLVPMTTVEMDYWQRPRSDDEMEKIRQAGKGLDVIPSMVWHTRDQTSLSMEDQITAYIQSIQDLSREMALKRTPAQTKSTFIPPLQTNQTEVHMSDEHLRRLLALAMEMPGEAERRTHCDWVRMHLVDTPKPEEFEIMTPSEELNPNAEMLETQSVSSPVAQMLDPSMSEGLYAIWQ